MLLFSSFLSTTSHAFTFYFQKTEEATLKRKRLAQLADCLEMANRIQLEMEGVKFLQEQATKEPEKVDGQGMEKLLKKLRKTAKRAAKCGETTHDLREKLDFK